MGNFQVKRNKESKGQNHLEQTKNVSKLSENQSSDNHMRKQIKKWTTFYRLNTHRFVEHYFGVDLFLFQKILLYFMNINTYFMLVAARGLSKSFMIAIFACARCVLYPNTKVVIASGVKKQAKLIITEKIEKELMQYPNLSREIKQIRSSSNEAMVVFHNGSTIEAVTSNENSRGYRGNILILEEFRMIDENVLKTVLKPFLNVYRQPPYLKKEKYRHLTEENIEVYISSAHYTSNWMWRSMQAARDAMLKGRDTMIFSLDYLTSIYHGLLSKERIDKDRESSDFDEISFTMEYENLMYGQNSNALYKLDDITKNRTLKKPFYPISNIEYSTQKQKRKEKLKDGEIRILSVDVALMGGDANDNTVITCMRLLPNGDKYQRKVPYIETLEGNHTEDQAIRIKQLFEDFQASYVALDTHGNGMSVYDALAKVNYDEERDVEYEAWCAFNDEEMRKRAKTPNPLPVVFSIKGNTKLNHEISSALRVNLQSSNIELLISEIEGSDFLSDKSSYKNADIEDKVRMKTPYIQTTLLVNELVNLNHEIVGGFIKIKEKSGKRKDRYSSLAYGNYLARHLESERLIKNNFDDDDDLVYF
ncbi:terminase family protein [Bacillus safensis]|uniref:terminase large subunit domain-containing protein n=1 Tax=Bacillus safensis TaxID=561879 RepID=UPI0022831FD7|nr:terminase family protein [Bacillus safensis]MCY7542500.1 terminase family protein [Bacillus safensis]MCY7552375.1 terminase family protein [Bacillus safensis]MCY7644806.1 terminase family protein [Bacillus safensis]MCY7655879.1 terminase family protein [Bacillus safensis]MEC3710353.1 terminase family protein [Bacillus safensis]